MEAAAEVRTGEQAGTSAFIFHARRCYTRSHSASCSARATFDSQPAPHFLLSSEINKIGEGENPGSGVLAAAVTEVEEALHAVDASTSDSLAALEDRDSVLPRAPRRSLRRALHFLEPPRSAATSAPSPLDAHGLRSWASGHRAAKRSQELSAEATKHSRH